MKIRRSGEGVTSVGAPSPQEQRRIDEQHQKIGQGRVGNNASSEEKIDVSRAALIQKELSPEVIASERSAKVQEIKELVASGKYFSSRSMSDIAKALAENLDQEIDFLKRYAEEE